MKIKNTQIAKMVSDRGYDYQKTLDSLDIGRTPEQEDSEDITASELLEMVRSICLSFDIEAEENYI